MAQNKFRALHNEEPGDDDDTEVKWDFLFCCTLNYLRPNVFYLDLCYFQHIVLIRSLLVDLSVSKIQCVPDSTQRTPTSEARVWFPAQPQVGKLVVACLWSAVYSTEP